MKYICTILLICGLFMGQAVGQDESGTLTFPDNIDVDTLMLDGADSTEYAIELPEYNDPMDTKLSIWRPGGSESEPFTLGEILALLERCREFVRDGHYDLVTVETVDLVYRPITLLSIAKDEAAEAKAKVERLERETQLRRDIDEMLGRLE